MLSVDTNVIVRFITADEPNQYARARALIDENDVWLGATVVLETEWVLRSVYRMTREEICAAIRGVSGLPRISTESATAVEQALVWHEAGADFADALHWALASDCEAFITFDKPFITTAARLGLPAREP
jgi:predicted nucleic-acid-binding protein